MDTTRLIDSLRQDLTRAAAVGGDDVKAAAERLLLALDPALRLTLMDALTEAATEIGEAMPGVSVSVRRRAASRSSSSRARPPRRGRPRTTPSSPRTAKARPASHSAFRKRSRAAPRPSLPAAGNR
jgi:hypothetical protein